MAGEGVEPNGNNGGAAPSSAPDYQAELAELRAYREQTQGAFSTLDPIADDVKWMLEADENRNFIRQARETYEASRKQREPELSPDGKILLETFKPMLEDWQTSKKTQSEQQKRAEMENARRIKSEADALIQKNPKLGYNNSALLNSIAKYGDDRGMTSLTDAYNEWQKDVGTTTTATPPRSLRGEATGGGVPGPSTAPKITSQKDLRARLKSAFASAGR